MTRSSVFLTATISLVVLMALIAPRPFIADDSSRAEKTIAMLERDWATAIVNKDLLFLHVVLAPDFNGTSPEGMMYTEGNGHRGSPVRYVCGSANGPRRHLG